MVDNTWQWYLTLRAIIFLLRSIAPLSVTFTSVDILRAIRKGRVPRWTGLRAYCAAETAFRCFMLCYKIRLQQKAIHPPLRTRQERKELIDKVSNEIRNKPAFLAGWFRGAKPEHVGREDLRVFLNWAFWEGRALPDADEHELEQYTDKVANLLDHDFSPGHGTAKGLRLSVDPIDLDCRSLFWYSLIMTLDTITHVRMKSIGFTYHGTAESQYQVFPPRPAAWVAPAQSPAVRLPYWSRPHTSATRLPIVFIHGLGIGLYSALKFLSETDAELNKGKADDDQVGIIVVEILQISSRLTHSILRCEEFIDQVTRILDANHFDRFVLAAHSYGSILSSYILNNHDLAPRVAGTLLIDPVSLLLHLPDVAYNFIVRPPRTAAQWQLWYFASIDPGVAHTLGRHLFWSQALLWRERIVELVEKGMRMTVSLSELDLIVDTPAVASYLVDETFSDPLVDRVQSEDNLSTIKLSKKEEKKDWRNGPWENRGLEILWWAGLDHAQVFDKLETRSQLTNVIVEYSKCR